MTQTAEHGTGEVTTANLADEVSIEDALAVLDHFGDPMGRPASGFQAALLEAISRADLGNQSRLALGFPGMVRAYQAAAGEFDGMASLRNIASWSSLS